MLNLNTPEQHKYNVSAWLQSVEKQIIEQRLIAAKAYNTYNSAKPEHKEYTRKCYTKHKTMLDNLCSSWMKLLNEEQSYKKHSNIVTNLLTFPLQATKT